MSDSEEYDSDSSSYSETTSDEEFPEDFGYWDPIFDVYRSKRTNKIISEEKVLEATDTNGYDTDHSETESDIGTSEDRKWWDLVYNACMNKGASSSTSKKIVLEFNTNANCNKISNDTEDKSPSTKPDPLGDRETDLILHKTEARHYAQIGNNNTGCPVGDIDNKLGSHGSVSTERKANENQTKPTEGTNIWAAMKEWRMNNSIQVYEQGDGNSKGYLAEFPADSAVNKDLSLIHI